MDYIDFQAASEEEDHSQACSSLIDKVCDHLKLPDSTFFVTLLRKIRAS